MNTPGTRRELKPQHGTNHAAISRALPTPDGCEAVREPDQTARRGLRCLSLTCRCCSCCCCSICSFSVSKTTGSTRIMKEVVPIHRAALENLRRGNRRREGSSWPLAAAQRPQKARPRRPPSPVHLLRHRQRQLEGGAGRRAHALGEHLGQPPQPLRQGLVQLRETNAGSGPCRPPGSPRSVGFSPLRSPLPPRRRRPPPARPPAPPPCPRRPWAAARRQAGARGRPWPAAPGTERGSEAQEAEPRQQRRRGRSGARRGDSATRQRGGGKQAADSPGVGFQATFNGKKG